LIVATVFVAPAIHFEALARAREHPI
jgi:hypothetical protein